ncbi:MAG: polysaccharide biosynthesis C-terminal domain-containing protein [Edaphocola sp.]
MGVVVRQSIKSVAITLAGVVMGGVVTVLSTRFFPKGELGFRENLIKVSTWVSYLALFGFNYTLLIYGQRYPPGHSKRRAFLTLSALVPAMLGLLVCVLFLLASPFVENLYSPADAAMMKRYIWLFPLLAFLTGMISWMEGYLQGLHKTALQNFAREILVRIPYISLILLYAAHIISFHSFLWWYVLLYLVPFAFLVMVAKRSPGFAFGSFKGVFTREEIKDIFAFSGYHTLTVASTVLIMQMDVFMLGPLDGFEVVAVYSIASLAVSMLRNPTRIIGVAATPAFTKCYNEGNMAELKELFRRSAVNMQVIGVGMLALVYINIDNIQDVMAMIKGGYDAVKPLVMILMLGQLFDMVTGLNFELIGVTKYYRFNFWIALVLMVVVFVLNYFLINSMGIYGAAWATTIGLAIFNIAKTVFLYRKMDMQPFGRATVWAVCAGLGAGLPAWALPFMGNVFIDLAIRSVVFVLLFWWSLFRRRISPELNDVTHNLIKKKKLY